MDNPYETSRSSDTSDNSRTASKTARWRLAPTIFFAALGAVGAILAVGFVILSVRNVLFIMHDIEIRNFVWETRPYDFLTLLFGPMLCASWGISWLYSAKCFWQRRWKIAGIMAVVGVVSLFGMLNLPIPR